MADNAIAQPDSLAVQHGGAAKPHELSVFFTVVGVMASRQWEIVLNYKQLARVASYLLEFAVYAGK